MVSFPAPHPAWLHWLDTCPSTNRWALDHLTSLCQGDIVLTPQQTAGRGQYGRIWHSPPGVITASMVLLAIPVAQLPGLSLMVGLAVINAIADLCPSLHDRLALKWANDVLLDGKKLGGILCESVINRQTDCGDVVIGIGLNRLAVFDPTTVDAATRHRAISLHEGLPDDLATVPTARQILERSRHHILQIASLIAANPQDSAQAPPSALSQVLPALRQRDFLYGKAISIELGAERFAGIGAGISDGGLLRLQLPNGKIKSFLSGHVIW